MFSNPRRPWESNIMNSPIINSPASSRYPSAQSPDMRGSSEAGSGTARDNKRLSSMASPLAYQPLPEESAVTYSSSADAPENTAVGHSHHSPQQNAAYSGSNRTSRYLSSSGGHGSTDSATNERRGSDATIETHQPTASSSRTSIFRPWSKMKKMASSSSGSGNGPSASSGAPPPPVPSSYPPFQS
ncbi:hypothetical protein GQ54DRAFT_299603 [Martensiomyces pterosporus]|nr:hypothetical protein GQ54DRAFT_299603 [Martensiomyces pterosporus]